MASETMEFGETLRNQPDDAIPQGLVDWTNRLLDDLGFKNLSEMRTQLFVALESAIKLGMTWEREQVTNAADKVPAPIPMRIHCPECGELHIDEGEFATKAHHTHACQHCGAVFRPAKVNTVGVRFLPGFKNEAGK